MTIIDEPAKVQDVLKPHEVSSAFCSALTFMATDSFSLTQEESSWVSYQLQEILSDFDSELPHSLPNAVSYELQTRQYSQALAMWKGGSYLPASRENKKADLEGWLDVFTEMITESYSLSIFQSAKARAKFRSIFENLGVGHETTPRATVYMPNAIRWVAANS